ncbi:hypothetical protein D3C85_1519340 [compost metagenome]
MAKQGQRDATVGADLELTRQFCGRRGRDLDLVTRIEEVFGFDVGPVGEGHIGKLIRANALHPTPIVRRGAGAAGQAGGETHQDETTIRDHGGDDQA